jgi:hypothetical protein
MAAIQIGNHAIWMGTLRPQGFVAHYVIFFKMSI